MKRQATFQVTRTGRKGPKRFAVAVAAGAPARRAQRRALVVVPRANVRTGGFMDLERKFKDFNRNSDAFTLAWAGGEMDPSTANSLSVVAQGDGESERDGRVYHIHSVHLKGLLNISGAESQVTPLNDIVARLALVWDTQTNGAQLNAEDVFLTIGSGEDVNSFRNLQNSKRFIVLKDKTFRFKQEQIAEGAANLFAWGQAQIPFKINKTFKTPIKVRCSGTTAAVTSVTDNSLHLIGTATDIKMLLTYQSRIRFTG